MERRIPTVFVTTHGAYPYIIENNKFHMQYKIIPKDMTVYILETASLGVCNINTALDNNLIGNEIEKYMKYGMHKEDLIYEIVDFMDEAHKDYTDEDLPEGDEEDEEIIHSRKKGEMYSLKKLVGGNFYYDKIFSRETKDSRAYNEINYDYKNKDEKKNKYDMRINFMNLEINQKFEDIDNSTRIHVEDMLGKKMDINIKLSTIIERIYESGFRYVIIIDNSCSSFYNEGDIELASKENLHKLYNDIQFVWLNTNIPNESDEKKRRRLLNEIHDVLNEEKPRKKQRQGGKRRKSKNHRRKRTNRKTNKKRLDR